MCFLKNALKFRFKQARDLAIVDDKQIFVVALVGGTGEVIGTQHHGVAIDDEELFMHQVRVAVLADLQPGAAEGIVLAAGAAGEHTAFKNTLNIHPRAAYIDELLPEVIKGESVSQEVNTPVRSFRQVCQAGSDAILG